VIRLSMRIPFSGPGKRAAEYISAHDLSFHLRQEFLMARRTFFSFHYERDVSRASVVRNSSMTKPNIDPEWIEAGIWEEAKTKGDAAIRKLITDALKNTSVTAVLIGAKTSERKWVQEEISQSEQRGNGLFGIYIHNIGDFNKQTDTRGTNPLPFQVQNLRLGQ
jgi:antiphage defense system Thoeris ThsB-like protein